MKIDLSGLTDAQLDGLYELFKEHGMDDEAQEITDFCRRRRINNRIRETNKVIPITRALGRGV